jgi:DNA transformation protein and related proteins
MGIKGDKTSHDSVITAELLVEKLAPIGGVTSKKMFGGHGLFQNGKMFGLIDSKGGSFMKADDSNRDGFLEKGSIQHSRMPYYSIPLDVFKDQDTFIEWAKTSIEISK